MVPCDPSIFGREASAPPWPDARLPPRCWASGLGAAECGFRRSQRGVIADTDATQKKRIAERYSAGDTRAELAREYEVSEPTIWRALNPFCENGRGVRRYS